jgi:hypothetical protein
MPGIFLMILLSLTSGNSAQTPQNPSTNTSPTLSETVQWIEPHLSGLKHTTRQTVVNTRLQKKGPPKEIGRESINRAETVSVASFEGCVLTLGQLVKGDDYTVVTISTIPFDRLTKASWKIDKYDPQRTEHGSDISDSSISPQSKVVITLESTMNAISWKRKLSGSAPLDLESMPYEGRSSSLLINSDDQAMPPRLVNAFNHAIQLCHVNMKPEPF